MKKLTILISLIFIFSVSFAQKGKVNNAYMNFKDGNITKAKKLIDEATIHTKTKDKTLTWVYRGEIYIGVYNSNTELISIDDQALPKAIEAFKKAKELDVSSEYTEQINKGFVDVASANYNAAVVKYNAKEYSAAGDLFSEAYTYAEIGNTIDTNSIYNSAVAYNLANLSEKAVKWYEKLINMNYDKPAIYSEYANILIELDQTDKAIQTISKGREFYPEDYSILITEANLFLKTGQTDKALSNLETALSYNSENFSIYHAIGTMYNVIFEDTTKKEEERFIAYDKAVDAYNTVIEMEPTYFDAVYNLGAIIFNKGVFYLAKADELPFGDKAYDELKKKGDDFLIEALPYLEKALDLNPEDNSTLFSLKQIYSRTGNMEKYKIIDQKLKDLQLE